MKILSFTLCLSLAAFACSKDKDEKAAGTAKAAESQGGASETVTLAQVGLKAELPKGANISDGIGGDGVMIQAADVVVSVAPASELSAKTLDEAKEEADMFSPTNIKTETLADGWVLTFENKGGLGTNYFVKVRREIAGKAYTCDTTASKSSQQDKALAICKSLVP